MNINEGYGTFEIDFDYENLDKFRKFYPKNIYFQLLKFHQLQILLELFDPSIINFDWISIQINSMNDFYKLEMLSEIAKSVIITIVEQLIYVEHKEYEANYQSITENLMIRT